MATLKKLNKWWPRLPRLSVMCWRQHRRYYSLTHRARNIIQSGELGQLVVSGQWTLRKADAYYDPDW